MRSTGIIRRIDGLGRIVVPKEIRRMLALREGDPMEIYLQDDSVIYKRYDYFGRIDDLIERTIQQIDDLADCYDMNKESKQKIIGLLKEAAAIAESERRERK